MKQLNVNEIQEINGGGFSEAAGAFGTAAGIGAAAFGSSWGSVGVGLAFAVSPIAVGAMVGLSLYAGYQLMK